MQTFPGAKSIEKPPRASAVCLGNFDGLHLGHRALVGETVGHAKEAGISSVVYTFSPHPVQVLRPEKQFLTLFTRQDLIEQLAGCGVDVTVIEPFDKQFSLIPAEQFIDEFLVAKLHPKKVFVGPDFAFGHSREGSLETLRKKGSEHGFVVAALDYVKVDGEPVSSSRIRAALAAGELATVTKMLGRNFRNSGVVIPGAGRGKKLGFATANMIPTGVATPARGVYVTAAHVKGQKYAAVTNVGGAPTFGDEPAQARLETHILDKHIELNGEQISIEFVSRLRGEQRFNSVDDLVAQVQLDIKSAREYWSL